MYISNCVCVRLVTQLCLTLCHHMDLQPTRLHCIWNFKGKTLVVHYNHFESENESHSVVSYSLGPHGLYTGVGSLPLLQGIFPTQGSSPGLLYYSQILYHLSHKGSPRILEQAVYPFSRGSSQPRNLTGVSRIVDGFFTN